MKHKLTQIAENGISLQRQTWTAEKRVLVMTWQRLFFVKKKTEQKGKNQKKNSVLKAGRYFFSSCRYKTNWPPSLIKVQRVQGRDGRRHNNHHGPFFSSSSSSSFPFLSTEYAWKRVKQMIRAIQTSHSFRLSAIFGTFAHEEKRQNDRPSMRRWRSVRRRGAPTTD